MALNLVKKNNAPELQLLKTEPGLMPILKSGDLIEATLIENNGRAAFFEISQAGTGILYGIEFSNAREILKKMNPGDSVTAKVVTPENEKGSIELSLAQADKQRAWQEVKELKERGEAIQAKITGANTGGLLALIAGLQAFLPASQLSNEHYPEGAEGNRNRILEELKKFVDQELAVKIINVNPRNNKLIISEREIVAENVKELLTKYNAGDVVTGVVSGVANFGAFIRFVDHPEIEGLIHISELSHNLVDHPKEVVAVGDMVKAQIIEIKDGRVSLSRKALEENPWDKVGEKFKEGETVKGTIYKLNPFGALIKLDPDIAGLIHVSEFGSVEELNKSLVPGSSHDFVIESIKPADKRIVLKLKTKPAKQDEPKANEPEAAKTGEVE
ncbi:MAG: S1 RNA-binding domain-containing protein [Candidatus Colwellbacteria bacterium]|nr:S1 RNA-binding domain-containing protein [Candidatus Colwellbacteria bacterium]